MVSSSLNGEGMRGLVGHASMYSAPPPPPPPLPKPRGTANPPAPSANIPAPPAPNFNISLRVSRILSGLDIHFLLENSPSSIHRRVATASKRQLRGARHHPTGPAASAADRQVTMREFWWGPDARASGK